MNIGYIWLAHKLKVTECHCNEKIDRRYCITKPTHHVRENGKPGDPIIETRLENASLSSLEHVACNTSGFRRHLVNEDQFPVVER